MKLFKYAALCICSFLLLSCVGKNFERRNKHSMAEQDSLLAQISKQDAQLMQLQSYLDILTVSMDSIAMQEDILYLPDPENPNKPLDKNQIKERLDAFSQLVSRQYDIIASLEDSLDTQNEALASLRRVIANYRTQIEQKDAEILVMKKELKLKDASISSMKTQVTQMRNDIKAKDSDIDYLLSVSDEQQKIMDTQDEILNEGYYLVKSKKELSALGIKSSDISKADIKLDNFTKVDIREFAGLTISSSRIKVITQMPTSSYELIENADGSTTLNIISPADFWQYSNVLIVQTR